MEMAMFNKRAVLIGLVLMAGGCVKSHNFGEGPKAILHEYIDKSFNITSVDDRKKLEDLLTGKAKTRLASWSDEQFRNAFLNQKRKIKNLLIRDEKEISPAEVNITYELTYLDGEKGADTKVTNRKLAYMVKEGGQWRINEVRNIKELIEYQNEMALP